MPKFIVCALFVLRYLLASGLNYSTEKSIVAVYHFLHGKRYSRITDCSDVPECVRVIAEEKSMAWLFDYYITKYFIALNFVDANGEPKVCAIPDDFAFQYITMYVPKGTPLKRTYDMLLLYFMQGGLINLWWKNVQYIARLEMASKINLPPGEYITLSMEHLQSAFYFLFLGYVLSRTTFILEQCVSR